MWVLDGLEVTIVGSMSEALKRDGAGLGMTSPDYIGVFAASNLLGAILLSPLLDTVGPVRMIAGTYILSGVLLAIAVSGWRPGTMLGGLGAVTLTLFGAARWDNSRFDQALGHAVTDGFVVRTAEGRFAAT